MNQLISIATSSGKITLVIFVILFILGYLNSRFFQENEFIDDLIAISGMIFFLMLFITIFLMAMILFFVFNNDIACNIKN
jgi:hypothetical protein